MCFCKSPRNLSEREAKRDIEEPHSGTNQIPENEGSEECEKKEDID